MIWATASASADTSMRSHRRWSQRFQASAQAASVGIHRNVASHEYVGRSNRSVQETIALLRRRAAVSASAMLAKTRKPLWLLRGKHQSDRPMSENIANGSIASTM